MAITAYFIKQGKRRNSTLQFALSGATSFSCTLKAPTSLDRPTFLLSYVGTFDFNLAYFDGKYYFVDDVTSVRDSQWEVSCIVDVLATYKSEILATSQFVAYANDTRKPWLADTRIPLTRDTTATSVALTAGTQDEPFQTGSFILTATGDTGTNAFILTETQISQLLASVNSWYDTSATDIFDGSRLGITYNFTSTEQAIESLSKIMAQSDVVGNAYANAPQCIRTCIWTPLNPTLFNASATPKRVMLGSYDTGIDAYTVNQFPKLFSYSRDIPWVYNDWRRNIAENINLSLPFLGQIEIPVDAIASRDNIIVDMYITALDGSIVYYVYADNDEIPYNETLIGVYKTSCACDYAIGLNQKASLGEVVQTVIAGASRMVSSLVDSSVSPQSIAGSIAGVALGGIQTAYDVKNVSMNHTPTTIGNLGSCALSELSFKLTVVSHSFSLDVGSSDYATTMGNPIMNYKSLSALTGFVQCVNAHVNAPAQANELDAIDGYVNTGFYIE